MSFFRRKSLFVLMIGIIILVILIGYSLSKQGRLSLPEQLINDSISVVQNLIYQPTQAAVSFLSNIEDIKSTYEENNLLREKLAEYKTLIFDVQELERENKELRELLELIDSPRDFEPILANVVARSPEKWLDTVILNKGKQHGVAANMAVITNDGMIGRIKTVSNFSSTVQLISGFDQLNRISAIITREEEDNIFGMIEGYEKESHSLIFTMIEQPKKPLKKGELVVTSDMGGLYPSGLLIGTVKEVDEGSYGLSSIAKIEPAAKMSELHHVIIVDRALDVVDELNDEDVES